jgi:molybdopterin molybdotransferase
MSTIHDGDDLIRRDRAVEHVLSLRSALVDGLGTESVALDRIAGRVLADPVAAPADAPPADFATMDGYAFDATGSYPFRLREGETFPEDEAAAIDAGEAVRIATGGRLPDGANAVIKREDATVEDGVLAAGPDVDPGTYVYGRASNVAAGETLFEPGERLAPRDAILLGDLGLETVAVRERFSVGLLATGTEIHEGRSRDLDSAMLANLIRSWGHEPTYEGSVPDDFERVRDRVADLAATHDVVVTTGGTSVGRKDYAVRALAALGDVLFHRVRIRPGKPLAAARLSDHDAVGLAVPGKPVGAHAVTTLVARPLFVGRPEPLPTVPATLARDVGLGPEGFDYVVPVTLTGGDGAVERGAADLEAGNDTHDGGTGGPGREAMPLGHVDSPLSVYEGTFDPSVLSSSTRATRADGFVVTREALSTGDEVSVVPYAAVE